MADSVFLGDGVEVDVAGALTGDGSAADPLAVQVDGTTIEINGSNQLAVTGALPSDSTVTVNAIGATSTDGLVLQNTTDAAAGAQQYSPRLRLRGKGWKTDATAASQPVDFWLEAVPVQGTAAPTVNLVLKASINGGAAVTVGTFTSAGAFTAAAGVTATTGSFSGLVNVLNLEAAAAGYFGHVGRAIFRSPADGQSRLENNGGTNTYLTTLADWGTTLSAESVSVADTGTLNLGAAPLGELKITVGTDNLVGTFQLRGSSNAVVSGTDNDALFTTTKDNAGTVNVYFDTTAYFIQNNRGGARAIRNVMTGA